MAPITLEKVTKVYPNGFKAVDDLNLDVADGEFMVLVGPSGCGKTTALRMVAGLEDITDGTLRISGPGRERRLSERPRHRHGLPELRPLPAHDCGREHRLCPEAPQGAQGRDQEEGERDRRAPGPH